jgi:hypothetical protein
MRRATILLSLIGSIALVAPLLSTACGGGSNRAGAAAVKPGNMPEMGSWEGVFFNPMWGFLHIKQEATSFTGRWKRTDESAWGEMHGTVTGDVARFEWLEHKVGLIGAASTTKGRGYFRYTRPEGDNVDDHLIGEWGLNEDEIGGGEWDAVKQRNMKPDLNSIKADTEPTVGGWK